MNSRISILPEKHVYLAESLFGLGSIILRLLQDTSKDLDNLWMDLQKEDVLRERINGSITLDKVILAVDFLFLIDAIKLNSRGEICHASA